MPRPALRPRRFRPWQGFVPLVCGLVLGCSGDVDVPATLPADASNGLPDLGILFDLGGTPDVVDTSTAVDTGPDVTPVDAEPVCPGAAGCPCTTAAECNSSFCIDVPTGKQCAQTCVDSCPSGQQCKTVSGASGDVLSLCLPTLLHLCNPCSSMAECQGLGLSDAACVAHGPAGSFCGVACEDTTGCPSGFECLGVTTVQGGKAKQCVPKSNNGAGLGACTCSDAAIGKKLSTACSVEQTGADGKTYSCKGTRTCEAAGLTACSAPPPGPESCNGEDDDCDGQTDEAACDDGNPCTVDTCGGVAGCTHTSVEGTACDADGSLCTQNDTCTGGKCLPGKAKVCDDGDPCTADACDPASGCTQTADDNAPCDDQNPCTIGDKCKGGTCQKGSPVVCSADDPCITAKCNLTTGKCAYSDADAGLPCDDGNLCTAADGCLGGACKGTVVGCDDGNPCTTDACSPTSGCQNTANSAPCDDGDLCTVGDTCAATVCGPGPPKSCSDGQACTVDSCDSKTGNCTFVGTVLTGIACDADGSVCTKGDTCQDGQCKPGTPLVCDDGNPCTNDSCDAKKGCVLVPNQQPCDDGNACTKDDQCSGGDCESSVVTCNDGKLCTTDACVPTKGCTYTDNSLACNDGSACTAADTCTSGACVGTVVSCDDGNGCTVDSCSPSGGCSHTPGTASCDDGNACTGSDTCGGGQCAGTPLSCSDGNPCTDDACDPGSGCSSSANTAACNDSDACTSADVCAGGKCGGTAVSCGDGNPCTVDACDKAKGCQNVVLPDNTSCAPDGGQWCQSGVCVAKQVCGNSKIEASEQCDDGNTKDGDGCSAGCMVEASKCVTLGKDVRTLEQGPEQWQKGCCDTLCENKQTTIPIGWHIATAAEVAFLAAKTKFGSCGYYGLGSGPKTGTSYWCGSGANLTTNNTTFLQYSCTTGGCWALTGHCYTQVMLIRDGKDGTCVL